MDLAWLHPRSSSAPRPDVSGLASLGSQIPFLFFLKKVVASLLLFQIGCRSSFSPLCFDHSSSAVSPRIPARVRTFLGEGGVYLCRICFGHHPSSSVLAHHHLFRCVAFGANAQIGGSSLFPFFWFFALRGVLPHVLIESFMQLIQIRRCTTRHLLCWLRHQRAFRAVSAFWYYYAARLIQAFRQSVSPSFSAVS